MKPMLAAVAALALAGCDINIVQTGPDEHDNQSVALDKSEMARVEMKMGVGELTVDGGSPKLMDADFTYNVPSWKPVVRYSSTGFRGNLNIEQPSGSRGGSQVHYRWNVRLNDQVPIDFIAHLGAGEARLNMGSMDLRSVEVNMGVGEVRLDLRGKPTRDYSVNIHGGVGKATVYLPRDTGIIASARGGIGNIDVRGLEKQGGVWINPAHEHAPVTIHVEVHGGVGEIQVIAE